MIAPSTLRRASWALLTAAVCAFAAAIAGDTLRTVVRLWSPLPWFDEWATVNLIDRWQAGDMTGAEVLFSQHNEHRILLPRLVFFADDLLFRGGGFLSLGAIVLVQILHAGLFAAVLGRSRPARPGRWAVAAVVSALMFSLRQAENFSSGFQLQFVAVFAGATLSFVLFGLAAARMRGDRRARAPLLASLGAALLTAFTMANGLVAGYVLVILALVARLRPRVVLGCAAWAAALTVLYLHGYEPVEHHARPADSLRQPLAFLDYVAAYLGNIVATGRVGSAAALGLVGIAATVWAAWRTARRGPAARPGALAMLGVMLFVGATAAITASGRLEFGVGQALSSRYVTGSVAFWAAQLTYWWIDPPGRPFRFGARTLPAGAVGRAAVGIVAAVLVFATAREQDGAKPALVKQSFAQNESADALMLGLDDPAATLRAAWGDDDVRRLVPTLKADRLSIFGTAEFAGVGRPVTDFGAIAAPGTCGGEIASAVADPALGPDGVRVAGTAWDGPRRRLLRRVLLADDRGLLAGFATGAVPGAGRSDWTGYAVARAGARLTAYGRLGGGLCRIGDAAVTAPAGTKAASVP